MMLQAPVVALVAMGVVSASVVSASGVFALRLLRHWDPTRGTRRQIELERRTELVATVLAQVLMLQAVALVLMVYNADRSAPLLVGAMCAFGSFNASAWGFPALLAKIGLFFGAGVWLALHHSDQVARDFPLTRRKYLWLLVLAPLAVLDAVLTVGYFVDLAPDTITSCCGSTFKPEAPGLAAQASALSPHQALWMLGGAWAAVLVWAALAPQRRWLAVAYGVVGPVFMAVALTAVVAAVSVYVYESPHHHCPFCLLKPEYGYVGFALYLPLFLGTAAALNSGVLSWRPPASLADHLPGRVRRLQRLSMLGFTWFALLSAVLVWRSPLQI